MSASKHQCSICINSFKDPKIISCHHSFCRKCLEDYVRTNLRNGQFNCPLCRESVTLPRGGVSGFKANFYIDANPGEKFAGNNSVQKFVCDLCGPKYVACSRCLDCGENLCQSCCYSHEKSKASRHHKIRDLGTLDSKMKGKIRQRTFCNQHEEEEIKLFCQDCSVLICFMCKVVAHENHATKPVADAAAKMRKTIQTKVDECTKKLIRINASQAMGDKLDSNINDAEREELQAVDVQRSQLNKVLDQEVEKMKARIKSVYNNLRQQNIVFKRDVQNELKMCSNAKENAEKLADQGTDVEIIKEGNNVKQSIVAAISKTDQTPKARINNKLFSSAEIKPSELTALIGTVQESTDSFEENQRSIPVSPFNRARPALVNKEEEPKVKTVIIQGQLLKKEPTSTQSSPLSGTRIIPSISSRSTFQPTDSGSLQQQNGQRIRKRSATTQLSELRGGTCISFGSISTFAPTDYGYVHQQNDEELQSIKTLRLEVGVSSHNEYRS